MNKDFYQFVNQTRIDSTFLKSSLGLQLYISKHEKDWKKLRQELKKTRD